MSVDLSAIKAHILDIAEDRVASLAESFRDTLRGFEPRRTGELAESTEVDQVRRTGTGASATVVVGADYARFVNDGTGIYGPEGRPITPTRADGVLVFDWPAAGGLVFARRVSGSEPTHFWERAVAAWPSIVATA